MGVFQWSSNLWRKSSLLVTALLMAATLAACGGGDDDSAAAAPQSLAISGTPPAQALQGTQYTFTPTVTGGGTLTFSITGTPSWATFSTTTGRLSGTPSSAQVGTVASNIRISVSDGTNTVNLPAFNIAVVATATGSALLTWTPPTQNTDGTPMTLSGYRVYWGTSQGNLSNSAVLNNGGLTSYMVEQLTPATWFFAVSAVSSTGMESALSNVASKQVL